MRNKVIEWIEEKELNIEKNKEFYSVGKENDWEILLREKDFKISKVNDICKWYFDNKRVFEYLEENVQKLKEFIEESLRKSETYNYSQDGVYVRELTAQTGFSSLISQIDKNLFIIPESQRNYVWTRDKVENLAISLIRGLPIPPIYAYRNGNQQLVVLDGQQRLISLYLYSKGYYLANKCNDKKRTTDNTMSMKDILGEGKIELKAEHKEDNLLEKLKEKFELIETDYKLKKIDETSYDIKYNKLSPNVRALVDTRPLTIIEIYVQGAEDPQEIYYNIFGNLNQGGVPLTNQELRNGIYKSDLYDVLHEINNNMESKFRKLFGPKHNKGKDIELLLRFVASEYMFEFKNKKFTLEKHEKNNLRIDEFKSSYPKLLNDFSKIAMSFSKKEAVEYGEKISNFFSKIEQNASIIGKKVDNLLLESLFVVDSKIEKEYKITQNLIEKIRKDKDYSDSIHSGSSAKKKVRDRLNRVYELILNYIEENNEL